MWIQLVEYLRGRRVLVWGYGIEGSSSVRFLARHLPGQSCVVADANPDTVSLPPTGCTDVELIKEESIRARLPEFDLILKSPGISLRKFGLPDSTLPKIRGQTDLFLQFAPGRTVGVTGTKGKSTTSSLIAHLLSSPGRGIPLVGNIGVPPWEVIGDLTGESICVLEMSSYQLENSRFSPTIALLLNLYQEHLNYHGSVEAYWTAKWNIARFQHAGQFFVYNQQSQEILRNLGNVPRAVNRVPFGTDRDFPIDWAGSLTLRGAHNRLNCEAAVTVATLLGGDQSEMQDRLQTFRGLPHRLECVGIRGGVTYYNDSISTVPESAMAAMAALPDTETIILGGQDRGVDYKQLALALASSTLKHIILISETGRILRQLLPADPRVCWTEQLSEAITLARKVTRLGGTCLFSPAAPSYNQFRNFEERGQFYKNAIAGGR